MRRELLTGAVRSGAATATGNQSQTTLGQSIDPPVDGGTVVAPQQAAVINAGAATADSGENTATGNFSENHATKTQTSTVEVGSAEAEAEGTNGGAVTSVGVGAGGAAPLVSGANNGGNGNPGNPNTPPAPNNGTDGADSTSGAGANGTPGANQPGATVGTPGAAAGPAGLPAVGTPGGAPVIAGPGTPGVPGADKVAGSGDVGDVISSTAGDAANASDGTAKVHTGDATATGNRSRTVVGQSTNVAVNGPGVIVAPMEAFVLNAGTGDANTGLNDAIGNESTNNATLTQVSEVSADQDNEIDGLVVASNSGIASNASDGEACSCTGDATATGNIADNKLTQSLDLSVGSGGGLIITPVDGDITNLGDAAANSGNNDAIGNTSTNDATTEQEAEIDPDAGEDLDGPQVANNGGEASNWSDGTGKVGTGNAKATGNDATSTMAQGAVVHADGGLPTVATIDGEITNLGDADADSGFNQAVGNDSINEATLDQDAEGLGLVSNSGAARNSSDGKGLVGDPDCEDKPAVTRTPPAVSPPGAAGLPKTGDPIEVELAVALMLLLAGFGLRRTASIFELRP